MQVLKEHYSIVSSLEWHAETNQLLSCSTDRGIIVWNYNPEGKLMPQLCIIKEPKANLDASWNHRGDKFCVGTASGQVFTGMYNQENSFWVATALSDKPMHKDSVLCVRFDPLSGNVVASASADGVVYVTTCFDSSIDKDGSGPFASVSSEGEILYKFNCNSWANTLSFTPSGNTLIFASHDCMVHFADMSAGEKGDKVKPEKLMVNGSPLLNGRAINDTSFVGCGFDKTPFLF